MYSPDNAVIHAKVDICFYSGLPFVCNLCPEDSAPCFYMAEIRKQKGLIMYSSDNAVIHAKVDISSREFIRNLAPTLDMSMAELSGSIIRKFIVEYSNGSNEYINLYKFVIKDGKLKEASL